MAGSVPARFLTNTLEQFALHAAAVAGLAAWGACPAAAAAVPLFLAGRLVFFAGYMLHPVARATGFALTALPTAGALLWCARAAAAHGLLP
jgi:hypothetical protein